MQELNDIVNAKLLEMQQNGTVEKLVCDGVERAISSAISDAFSARGAISRAIEKAIADGFQLDTKTIDFESYNAVMLSAVKQKVASAFGDDARNRFMQEMDKVLEAAPESIDIHEFISRIAELWRNDRYDSDEFDDYATVKIKDAFENSTLANGRNKRLHIWNKASNGRYTTSPTIPQVSLFISDGDIRISHRMAFNPTCLYPVDAYIFKLYAAGTKITGIEDYDPDEHEYQIRDSENDY